MLPLYVALLMFIATTEHFSLRHTALMTTADKRKDNSL